MTTDKANAPGSPPTYSSSPIIVVSGLPRSGTSMMMQVLGRCGLALATDGRRAADADNPRGYFELEATKNLPKDASWMMACRGQVVKIVSPLLQFVPSDLCCKIIFMERDVEEILASQGKMLARRGHTERIPRGKMRTAFESQVADARRLLSERSNMTALFVSHADVLEKPANVAPELAEFLEIDEQICFAALGEVIDPSLHRQKASQQYTPTSEQRTEETNG